MIQEEAYTLGYQLVSEHIVKIAVLFYQYGQKSQKKFYRRVFFC